MVLYTHLYSRQATKQHKIRPRIRNTRMRKTIAAKFSSGSPPISCKFTEIHDARLTLHGAV